MADFRDAIKSALATFVGTPLRDAAGNLLATLNYRSDRTVDFGNSSPEAFLAFTRSLPADVTFNETKAIVADWKSIDLLFQLTDDELSGHQSLFKETTIKPGLLRSYVFFAIELTGNNYARGKLTGIARQINRIFPMPVMVLIKHSVDKRPVLSIAVINRRQNKRDASRDVLGKVTIIRDVSLSEPHRGHLDILASFAAQNLVHPQRLPINNFDTLHAAWEEIFNVELLNKRFYRELANWYFWALPQVEFPADTEKDDEKRRATSLIRLLTRLIFCWFLKEKGLVPEELFNASELEKILVEFSPDTSTYYQGILQNLFFATLNQRMGKDKNGKSFRAFARDEGFQRNRTTYGITNLYRYEEYFRDPASALDHFAGIPFLNGGLFECLDRPEVGTNRTLYVDGFSRNKEKRARVPNHLFFAAEQSTDLSGAYGESKHRNDKVRGLLAILHSYKFTIVENTPIDQEIALDPELLGKVFENLLASYNEETKTTARKQTGSFYTPRSIVEYMVDESLRAHLTGALTSSDTGLSEEDVRAGLDILFTYTEREHPFRESEVSVLLDAIHQCKILDPACGSGAFPMGILQKLVYIIHKLDPNNAKWKQLQIDAAASIPDSSSRAAAIAAIERDFAENEDDYGRKLYLIENCLYGVDIQPIAIQISKLRFFISLICDQKTNRSKKDNHGVRPLPNLETKFVAADTLLRLDISQENWVLGAGKSIHQIEEELQRVRHDHFAATTREKKLGLQERDRELRDQLAKELTQSTFADQATSLKLAAWNPYDSQQSANFFEPLWMFDRSLADGFDILIGNPPYQSAIEHKKVKGEAYRASVKQRYRAATGTWDLYIPFFEASLGLLRQSGILSLITPNKFLSSSYGIGLRTYLPTVARMVSLTDVSHLPVFESASVYPVISVLQKGQAKRRYEISLNLPIARESKFGTDEYGLIRQMSDCLTLLPENLWGFLLSPNLNILKKLLGECTTLDALCRVRATTTAAEADELGRTLRSFPCSGWKTLNTGTIDPFSNHWATHPIRHQKKTIALPVLPDGREVSQNRRELYSSPKLIIAKMALRFEGFVDRSGEFAALNCNCISEVRDSWTIDALAVVLHSSVVAFAYKQYFDGLRMGGGYLPFQAPQLKTIPIPICSSQSVGILSTLGRIRSVAADVSIAQSVRSFWSDLSDACVMECYFREHMAERDLLILDEVASHVTAYVPDLGKTQQREFIEHLQRTLNASDSKIRNRLLRISADSPDLLAIIKGEGRL